MILNDCMPDVATLNEQSKYEIREALCPYRLCLCCHIKAYVISQLKKNNRKTAFSVVCVVNKQQREGNTWRVQTERKQNRAAWKKKLSKCVTLKTKAPFESSEEIWFRSI